jgi:hypothetical protein
MGRTRTDQTKPLPVTELWNQYSTAREAAKAENTVPNFVPTLCIAALRRVARDGRDDPGNSL